MSPHLNRVQPLLPVQAMKTYQVSSPLATHWRPATCAEVDCQPHQHGWATTVLPGGADEAAIKGSGRHWSSAERTADGFVRYVFPPGQPCFAAARHKVQLDRPELFSVRGGDFRGNPTGEVRRHAKAEDFVEDFGEHQQRIHDAQEKG
jgi:hypothetical protein